MSAQAASAPLHLSLSPRRIARLRAVLALVWAAALALVAGDDAGPDLAAGLAALVTAYPLIDVAASLAEATGARRPRLVQVNAVIGALAVAALAVAAFGSDAGAVLAVFGAWAVVSGALQLAGAVARRRAAGAREIPMLISGGLSTLAGASFIASSGAADPSLTPLAGYAAFGAVLFLVWSVRSPR